MRVRRRASRCRGRGIAAPLLRAVSLDATRLGRDAALVAQEVVQHLAGLLGARVEVTLEIRAEVPDGVPERVVRTVSENCRTLKFTSHEFEAE